MTDMPTETILPTGADPDWWRGAVIYQIYPRSFQDSNGDGIGDLAGIVDRLDYVASLGVDAIWLSPFFTSPMLDFGYDVADYCDVDPMFGTLADFDRLIARARSLGIRVIIDLVLSHTSDRHPWFVESRSSRDNAYADWYVWADPKPDGTPPTNWLSIFGGSSWEWESGRQQYFLHNFLTTQPDLNLHNPAVQTAVLDVARFWLDRGVSGFRLDTVNFYFHDRDLRDNPPANPADPVTTVPRSNPYSRQLHLHDKNRPENLAFLERLRALLNAYPDTTSVGELGTDHDVYPMTAAYTEAGKRIHMAYSFELFGTDLSANDIRRIAEGMDRGLETGWVSWALSNHDVTRVVSRWGHVGDADRFAPLALALVTCLRGTPSIYQGEELGLPEADVPFELLQDPYGKRFWPTYKGRDGCRTPMPWRTDHSGGGFTTGTPWLPLSGDHLARSVETETAAPGSVLNRVRTFLHWRREQRALVKGTMRFVDAPDPVLAFVREDGLDQVLVALNMSGHPATTSVAGLGSIEPLSGHGFDGASGGQLDGATLRLGGFGAFFGRIEQG